MRCAPRVRAASPQAFVRGTGASAGLEMALGAVALLTVATLCVDLYARVEADTISSRLAVAMADYVSRGPDTDQGTLDGASLEALGKFLVDHELWVPADVVFIVSLLRQDAGTPRPAVEVLWSDDELRFGDTTVTANLASDCARLVSESGGTASAVLPTEFTMDAGEVLVVVEVCARLTVAGSLTGRFVTGNVYRLHVLPVREPGTSIPAPVHAHRSHDTNGESRA